MPIDHSLGRNVHFYDASKPGITLGGLIQSGSVTEANFLDMIGILLATETPLRVQEKTSGHVVATTNNPLQPGEYDVYCDMHIFPLEKESLWIHLGYSRWITDMEDAVGISKINSLQNRFLLRSDIHQLFDQYLISVNPDDNYKIVVFDDDYLGLDGWILDPVCCDPANPHRVSDQLLRWHFRQSILANMRGVGEPTIEHDFPSGTDTMTEIREGPYAQERLEMEFASRLRAVG
ncbi:hypothetical protein L873DRAFT_1841125 [Choiromyces venosus 120613-1]|uniref:DUF7881 domain-containing protein n=1 Tax=Choiromyces venosus 120613-1 TaxID=1336337 RepID=A0A3N4K2A8_9PEZI|nr:hypothetical protein L873DRAFT_1841125 [Choiromyces venosus 120613-1]